MIPAAHLEASGGGGLRKGPTGGAAEVELGERVWEESRGIPVSITHNEAAIVTHCVGSM